MLRLRVLGDQNRSNREFKLLSPPARIYVKVLVSGSLKTFFRHQQGRLFLLLLGNVVAQHLLWLRLAVAFFGAVHGGTGDLFGGWLLPASLQTSCV